MEPNILSTHEINQLIAKKAGENEEFRLAMLNDPKSALEKEYGVVFPENTKVEVHVESMDVLHLIIPAAKVDELTDDQLEEVAGGVMGWPKLNPGDMVMAYGVPIPGGDFGWNWNMGNLADDDK